MGIFDSIFRKKKDDLVAHTNDVSMQDMEKIQNSLQGKMDDSVYNNTFNQACRLVPKGQYAEALAMFENVKANTADAHQKGNCDNQIGVCHFFMNDFEKAIEAYANSIQNGFDRSMADDNIWEACEKLMQRDHDKARWAKHYLELLPNGNYKGKAQKHLG